MNYVSLIVFPGTRSITFAIRTPSVWAALIYYPHNVSWLILEEHNKINMFKTVVGKYERT